MLKSFAIGILFLLPTLTQGASFDCAKAITKIEKLICSDPELSELDTKLTARYERALKGAGIPSALLDQQRKWLRDVRNRCADVSCLRAAYKLRRGNFEWVTIQSQNHTLCEEFRSLENKRGGLTLEALEEKETGRQDFNWAVPNIDVDGDKINDQILLFRAGSASLIPPDDSSLSLTLSSTGETFTIEAQRLYAIGYKSNYYVLTTNWKGEYGPVQTDINRLERKGIKQLCSYQCGLVDGSCEH